ncbi:MAG: tyrosine-type recombinase/integrase [Microvirga sp.]
MKTNTNALFPSRRRSAIAPPLLSERIKQMVKRRTGLDITAHEFRHAAAAMLLKAQPGNYALVAKVLGHKAVRTAIAYYIGLETLDANRIFASIINDDLLAKRRG